MSPGCDHDLVGGDLHAASPGERRPGPGPGIDPQPPGTGEGGVAEERRRVRTIDAIVLATR